MFLGLEWDVFRTHNSCGHGPRRPSWPYELPHAEGWPCLVHHHPYQWYPPSAHCLLWLRLVSPSAAAASAPWMVSCYHPSTTHMCNIHSVESLPPADAPFETYSDTFYRCYRTRNRQHWISTSKGMKCLVI
jgi:hypothetical protein